MFRGFDPLSPNKYKFIALSSVRLHNRRFGVAMPKKISMSIEDVLKRIKNGVYAKALTHATTNKKAKISKADLVCFKGIPSTISFIRINNN